MVYLILVKYTMSYINLMPSNFKLLLTSFGWTSMNIEIVSIWRHLTIVNLLANSIRFERYAQFNVRYLTSFNLTIVNPLAISKSFELVSTVQFEVFDLNLSKWVVIWCNFMESHLGEFPGISLGKFPKEYDIIIFQGPSDLKSEKCKFWKYSLTQRDMG